MGQLSYPRAGVAVAFFAQGLGFAAVLTHLPAIKDRYGLDDLAITGLMFGVAVLAGVGSTVAGIHAGRHGSAVTLRLALLVAAVGLIIAGLAGSLPMFLAGVGIYGLGLGTVDASENMQAVALERRYGRSILTSFHASWSAGGIAGALYTSLTDSWALSIDLPPIAVIIGIVACAPYLVWHDERPADRRPGDDGADLRVAWRPLLLLGLALVLFYVADSAAASWSTVYLRDGLSSDAAIAPLAYAAYLGASLLSRLSGDFLVRVRGAVQVVRLAAATGTLGLLLVVIAPAPAVAILGFAVLGAGLAVVAPLTFSAVGTLAAGTLAAGTLPGGGSSVGPASGEAAGGRTAEQRRRQADALVARLNQFNYLGFVLGGVLTGLVSSAGSLRWGFVVPLVLTAVLITLAPAFAPRRAAVTVAPAAVAVPAQTDLPGA